MKHGIFLILLSGILLCASEVNPFELEKNLQKIDEDKDVLLNTLKVLADKKEKSTLHKVKIENIKIASPRLINPSTKDLPEELKFFKLLVFVHSKRGGKALESSIKNKFKAILKEKNNPKFQLSDVMKIIAKDVLIQSNFAAYMFAKAKILKAKEHTEKEQAFISKFSKNIFQEKRMKMLFNKYPFALEKLAFASIEDMVLYGIPQIDFPKIESPKKIIKQKVIAKKLITKKVLFSPRPKKIKKIVKIKERINKKHKIEENKKKLMADRAYQKAIMDVD